MKAHILVIDDDNGVVEYLTEMLTARGYVCTGCDDATRAMALVAEQPPELIISDIEMPGMRGVDLLMALRAARHDVPLIFITAFGSVDLAVSCMRAGAADFVTKPFKIEVLSHSVERVLRERSLQREVTRLRVAANQQSTRGGLVARSEAMKRVLDLAERAARTDTPVLLTGESGTGKGAVAHFIHAASGRAGELVSLNCATLPAQLAESELFGVRRGAFTDAREDRPGLFVAAKDGTLFLDEIGELPLDTQPKLLSALEDKRVRPVGGNKEIAVSARVVAATNRALEDALRQQRFRPDLYYRLNVIRIEVPPLRQRREDIAPLLDAHLQEMAKRSGRSVHVISERALRWLMAQPWHGNVRELLNVLERAVTLSDAHELTLDDFVQGAQLPADADAFERAVAERWPLDKVTVAYVKRMLDEVGGNKAEAARLLGIDRRTLYSKLGG